jgi:hypothetical protein
VIAKPLVEATSGRDREIESAAASWKTLSASSKRPEAQKWFPSDTAMLVARVGAESLVDGSKS